MKKLQNKLIWITGASSGIGKALALELARDNNRIILSSQDEPGLQEVSKILTDKGIENYIVFLDLGIEESIKTAVQKVKTEIGICDVLVNNGGISQRSLITETSMEMFRKIMEIDFFGNVILTKEMLPDMIANGGGHIAAVSSISGKFGFPLRSAYASAKHAIYGFFETLHAENKKHNIHVTLISPGRVQTNISMHALTNTGKAHGKMDAGQAGGISAESCARQMHKAIASKRTDVNVGGKELLMVHIKRFFPRLFYKLVLKINPT